MATTTPRDAAKIERFLARGMTAGDLIDLLSRCDPGSVVVFQSDYGDYNHTQQALPVREVEEVDPSALYVSEGYSRSGVAIRDEQDGDEQDGDEQPEHNPAAADLPDVVVLRML